MSPPHASAVGQSQSLSATPPSHAAAMVRLTSELRTTSVQVTRVAALDGRRRGAVAARGPAGMVRRVEPGSLGPLALTAAVVGGQVELAVWGPPDTPRDEATAALKATAGWVGLDDELDGFADVIATHPVLRHIAPRVRPVIMSRLPRVGEALGRGVLNQLVQGIEARRSVAQVAARHGTPTELGLWTWPTAAQIGATPAWALRRCGVSLRSAGALHAGALADGALGRCKIGGQRDWAALDARLRSLPGVGLWTSAETRYALGDADAVSVGDYHLPGVVCAALTNTHGSARTDWDDATMVELLAPFAPHRGRVIRLLEGAAHAGLVATVQRRAPRAALSAHRYW